MAAVRSHCQEELYRHKQQQKIKRKQRLKEKNAFLFSPPKIIQEMFSIKKAVR